MGIAYFTREKDPVVVYKTGGFGLNTKNEKVMLNFQKNILKMKKLVNTGKLSKQQDK